MQKTSLLLGLLMAIGLVGYSSSAEAQTLGIDLSLKLEKNFNDINDRGPTFFRTEMYLPVSQGTNWTLGPIVSYGANVSNFNLNSRGFGFRQDNWTYGVKFTIKL